MRAGVPLDSKSRPKKEGERLDRDAAVYDSASESSNRAIATIAAGALAFGAAAHLVIEYLIVREKDLWPIRNASVMIAVAALLLALVRVKLRPRIVTYALQAFFIVSIPTIAAFLGGSDESAAWSVAFIFLIGSLIYIRPTFIIITVATLIATQAGYSFLHKTWSSPEGFVDILVRFSLLAIGSGIAVVVNKKYSDQLRLNFGANRRLTRELEQSGTRMGVLRLYTRKSLVQIVESGRNPSEIMPESKELAVMFCDIRDFARLSQKLEPTALISMLNDFYEAMGQVIGRNGGEIDKLIGDCIMATFPDADSSLRAAIEMKEALFDLNDCNRLGGLPALRTGIGIHFGTVIAGNLGSREKMDLTIIGDTVNVASRIETLTKFYITDVLVSEDFKNGLRADTKMRYIDTVLVKGREGPVRLYEVYHHHRPDTIAAKEGDADRLDSAQRFYAEGHFSDAISLLLQMGEKAGDHGTLIGFYKDPFINVLLDRCLVLFQRQKTGDLPDWDGIFRFQEK
jgi:class 3 adenylate cyclase